MNFNVSKDRGVVVSDVVCQQHIKAWNVIGNLISGVANMFASNSEGTWCNWNEARCPSVMPDQSMLEENKNQKKYNDNRTDNQKKNEKTDKDN